MGRREIESNPITDFLHNGTVPPEKAGIVKGNAFYPGKQPERLSPSVAKIETSTPEGYVVQMARSAKDVQQALSGENLDSPHQPKRRQFGLRRVIRIFSPAH